MSSNVKKEFLDLGRHPIANAFLQKEDDFSDEFFFDLKVCWDEETKLGWVSVCPVVRGRHPPS